MTKNAKNTLRITLTKSLIGRNTDHILTANSMGLRKPGDVSVQPKNEATAGKISKISYMVNVVEE